MPAAGAGTTAGWTTVENVTATLQQASSGSPATGSRYNWGNGTTTTDRAIGFMTSGSYASTNAVMAHYINTTGSTVDMRGMILKDFSSSGTEDDGGAYEFKNIPFWSAIPVGTLIALEFGSATSSDTVASDFVLKLGGGDTTYFTLLTTVGGNLGGDDLVMIKAAGLASAGNLGAIHAFAIGTGSNSGFSRALQVPN